MNTISHPNSQKIATLNDALRKRGEGGRIMLTTGIQALGQKAIQEVIKQIWAFDAFTEDNDPYGEHDFASITVNENKIFWKIDAYDRNLEYASHDPTDPALTVRIMTVMLAEEY